MTPADLSAVAEIARMSSPSPWLEAAFRMELEKRPEGCRVARAGDRVAAFLVGWHLPGETQVVEMAVHPEFRRRGAARRLLADLIRDGRERGSSVVTLEVRAGNGPAQALYRSLGFVATGRRPRYYEGREDAILMEHPFGEKS